MARRHNFLAALLSPALLLACPLGSINGLICSGNGRCAEGACPVFVMTNARDESALAELRAALPTMVRYVPSAPRFAGEGPRLLVKQAIAARADAFVPTGRSSVSEFVELLRRRRARRPRSDKVELCSALWSRSSVQPH